MIQVLASQKVAAGRFQRKVKISARFIAELLAAELPGFQGSWATLRNDIRLSESGLVGGIKGLIKSSAQGVNVAIEPRLSFVDKLLRPDLLISQGDDRLVVEVKKYRGYADRQPMNEQLAEYSRATNAIGGIGVLVPYVFPENAALIFRCIS